MNTEKGWYRPPKFSIPDPNRQNFHFPDPIASMYFSHSSGCPPGTIQCSDLHRHHFKPFIHNDCSSTVTGSNSGVMPPLKRRRFEPVMDRAGSIADPDLTAALLSRDEIERSSPSRRDGIDSVLEARLRNSYCIYLQRLGARLELPQTTIATAVVFCHRFFLRRSHACQDRFLIATAALFLAAKSEETPCPLNTILRASIEVSEYLELFFMPYMFSGDWFEQYRERITGAEQMILTTLDFELDVAHPYTPLSSIFTKLGLSQSILFKVAWNIINEGLRSSLWLQFKPHHIAAGAAFLAAKFLQYDITVYPNFWFEFQTTPYVVQDVVQQLTELL